MSNHAMQITTRHRTMLNSTNSRHFVEISLGFKIGPPFSLRPTLIDKNRVIAIRNDVLEAEVSLSVRGRFLVNQF